MFINNENNIPYIFDTIYYNQLLFKKKHII